MRSPNLNAGTGEVGEISASTFSNASGEILANQLTHFLRAQIISVVITGAQNISAENDPAFHFPAETFFTRAAITIEDDLSDFPPGVRSGRHQSERGWLKPRPWPECNRPQSRIQYVGNETSTISAPNEFICFTAASIAVLTCGSIPSIMIFL